MNESSDVPWMAPVSWGRCDSTPSNRQNAVVNNNNLEGTIGLSAHAAERPVDCILRL
jgi:hypothetical protein